MKNIISTTLLILLSVLKLSAQLPATFSVIATSNSTSEWVYFRDPYVINPASVFTTYASNFGLGTDDAMQYVRDETDNNGITHKYYSQYYKYIPVDACHVSVHT